MFRFACAVLLALTVVFVSGCGGTSSPNNNPDTNNISVTVSPTGLTLQANEQYLFRASASGGTDTTVTWTVTDEIDGGIVSSTGLYTAPSTDGHTSHVRATSVEDPTEYMEAIVTIEGIDEPPSGNNGVEVKVSPKEVFLPAGEQAQFTATVTGHSNHAVTWTVDETNAGVIAADGTYTAPSSSCTANIRATSQADPTKSDTALMIVLPSGGPPVLP